MTRPLEDPLFLRALETSGVDNWEWYDESLSELGDDPTDLEVLQALETGGVDNWTWYGEALDEYRRLTGEDDEEEVEPPAPKPEPEPEDKELDPSEKLLLSIVGEEAYPEVRRSFFARSGHTKEFDKAVKLLATGGTREDARLKLVKLVYKIKD